MFQLLLFQLLLFLFLSPNYCLAAPRIQVSCPGLRRTGKSRTETSCDETPVRIQFVVDVDDKALDCKTPGAAAASSDSDTPIAATGAAACPNCPQGYHNKRPSCDTLAMPCSDDRDCCSMWCGDNKLCEAHNLRRQLQSPPIPLDPQHYMYDDEAVYAENSNYCTVNSDCLSFRCIGSVCDDALSTNYVNGNHGCEGTSILMLYTLSLSLDADVAVGLPDLNTNPEYTQTAFPGDFVDVSFPGQIVLNYRIESCTEFNKCVMSEVQQFTINVKVNGHQTDASQISEDNKPAKGGNYSYIRSAVVFNTFKGGAGKFNRSGFVKAVVNAINYDRKTYKQGEDEKQAVEEFRFVPSKAVSIVVIDPKEKMVQYEVRVRNTDANAVRNRLLHSYFVFPLVLELSKFGILPHVDRRPFQAM